MGLHKLIRDPEESNQPKKLANKPCWDDNGGMPDYNAIYQEYIQILQTYPDPNLPAAKSSASLSLRAKYLGQLAMHLQTNVIAYYSTWVQSSNTSNPNIELNICDNDMNGLMNAVSGLDHSKGLSLLLHTPGGGVSATQAIADYLLDIFDKKVTVIVPTLRCPPAR